MTDRQLRANNDDGSPVPQEPNRTSRVDVVGCAVQLTATTQTSLQQRRRDQAKRAARRLSDEVTTGGIHVTTTGQHHIRTRRGRLLTTAVLAAAVTIVTAGCSKDNKGATPPLAGPSAPASPTVDPQEAEKTALLGVYRAFWDASLKAYSTGSMKNTGMETVGTDKAYAKVQATQIYYRDNGFVMTGAPILSPKVTALDAAAEPPKASITDCIDSTNYIQVEKESGKPVGTLDKNRRHVATYTALKIGGSWQIRDFEISRDQLC